MFIVCQVKYQCHKTPYGVACSLAATWQIVILIGPAWVKFEILTDRNYVPAPQAIQEENAIKINKNKIV